MQENNDHLLGYETNTIDMDAEQERLGTVLKEGMPYAIIVKKVRTCDDGTECYELESDSPNALRWFYKNFCLYEDVTYLSLSDDSLSLTMELENV